MRLLNIITVFTAAGSALISQAAAGNFFDNQLFPNPKFTKEIESTIPYLNSQMQAKAKNVEKVGSAVWLSWEGAQNEVASYLRQAGSRTITFILYMIPTRDCNSNASAGGSSDLNKYKGYVNNIANTIKQFPNSKVAMVIEPDTLGNLVTGNSANCRNVHNLHKQALAYAANVFGRMNNVQAYLDVAHSKWLGSQTDKVAQVIREILNMAQNSNIRGFSTNVSNYQPIWAEYEYHKSLSRSLERIGIRNKKFIVDTGRNGIDVRQQFNINQTWCNFKYAALGEPSRGSPDRSRPLIDAYIWLKTPGESDGSSRGSRADPVCARNDSFQGAPDAGQWFSQYFSSMLEKSPFFKTQNNNNNNNNRNNNNNNRNNNNNNNNRNNNNNNRNNNNNNNNRNCAGLWAQCGGRGYRGATCCAQGSCKWVNEYYSQCKY